MKLMALMKKASSKTEAATTEETVRKVLGKTYKRFGFNQDTAFIADIVALMDTPTVIYKSGMSEAAGTVHQRLLGKYFDGGKAASATCNLFVAVGRESELGWIRQPTF